jgi:hypothetical protein
MATYLSNGNARQQNTDSQEMNRTGIWLFWNVLHSLLRFTEHFLSAISKFLAPLPLQKVSTAKQRLALIVPTNFTRAMGTGVSGLGHAHIADVIVSE